MPSVGQFNDMYKQLQECMLKCDSLSQQLKTVREDVTRDVTNKLNARFDVERTKYEEKIKYLENKVDTLQKENEELKIKNQLLENEVDRLKSLLNKDSDNSSKPPSTDIKPNKKIPNNRQTTSKKSGGQKGHKPHYLSKESIEEKIKNGDVEHIVVEHGVSTSSNSNYISKYEITYRFVTVVKEHRFFPDINGKYSINNKYSKDVFYGNELKALCSFFNVENSMPLNKIVSTLNTLSNGVLSLSEGTVVNFIKKLSGKCKFVLDRFVTELLNSNLMYTDETGVRCENSRYSVRNYTLNNLTVYKVNRYKNLECIKKDNILNNYVGNIVHDHDTTMYNFGRKNIECNVHVCRYLKGNSENTCNAWSDKLRTFFNRVNNSRKIAQKFGLERFEEDDEKRYEQEYDQILEQGFLENKKTSSKYYQKEELKLLKRLKKYKENHILFIRDFSLPFDNNPSENDIRVFKIKTKVSGCFRSKEGLENFANILSVVKTARKRGLTVLDVISNIYNEKAVAAI